jgi:VWFA-related protein
VRAAGVALILVLATFAGRAQQPIRVGANFVRVDVLPTKDGRVVDGLLAADFEVLEDGVPQKVETFEHVVPSYGPHTARTQPSSQRDMVRAVANPRSRIFLIFLDAPFVDFLDSHAINDPLIRFMRDDLADDDLVAIMTPNMSAQQIVFGNRTEAIERGLKLDWKWGRQNRELDPELDRREIQYGLCYPPTIAGDVAAEMIARRRERVTLESLQDAVKYLHSLREERKAIVAVSQGWQLYPENPDLMRQRPKEAPLGIDKIHVGPTGTLTLEDKRNTVNAIPKNECEADRGYLARIDNERFLREIIDDANRANATFYTIDPAGLSLRGADRRGGLRTLAENTDGFSILNTNDLRGGMTRILNDLSSYYLLGYHSSNAKADGRFRTIAVKVKRPDVQVRARRGYRAPTREETLAAAAAPPAAPTPSREAGAVTDAIARLASIRPDARFRILGALTAAPTPAVWVSGELQASRGRPDEFAEGATATIDVAGGGVSANARVVLKPGERTFLTRLDLRAVPTGALDVRARLSSDAAASAPLNDGIRLEPAALPSQALLFRRGGTTGNRLLPAADLRFSRTERMKLEIPVSPSGAVPAATGRLLDRGGQPRQVAVTMGDRTDEAGQRWISADVTLAALGPGDYAIEIVLGQGNGEHRILTPVRIVP